MSSSFGEMEIDRAFQFHGADEIFLPAARQHLAAFARSRGGVDGLLNGR
jgi:hypothetical protein